MAPLVSGAESGDTIASPGKLTDCGRSSRICHGDSARSQFAPGRRTACRQTPARNQQRRCCRPTAGAVSGQSMFLGLEETLENYHNVNPSTHNLGVHLCTCSAFQEPLRRLSTGEGNKLDIWRTHAANVDREDSDVSVCPTSQAQARNIDSAATTPTDARLYSTPSCGSSSPCPSQITPDTCVMLLDPHTPDTTLRFEDFVNFTPTELPAR